MRALIVVSVLASSAIALLRRQLLEHPRQVREATGRARQPIDALLV